MERFGRLDRLGLQLPVRSNDGLPHPVAHKRGALARRTGVKFTAPQEGAASNFPPVET